MGQSENQLNAVHFWTHIMPERGHILKTENKLFAHGNKLFAISARELMWN